ncbi:MAG: hypothetical protein QXT64_01810 [Desulfurococcaceae archaeon]
MGAGLLGIFKKRVKKPRKVYVVIDGDRKEYVYIDGKYIPRDRIVSIDTTNRKVVYLDYDGALKVGSIPDDHPVDTINQRRKQEGEVPISI